MYLLWVKKMKTRGLPSLKMRLNNLYILLTLKSIEISLWVDCHFCNIISPWLIIKDLLLEYIRYSILIFSYYIINVNLTY